MKILKRAQFALMVLAFLSLAAGQTPQPREATLVVGSATMAEVKGEVLVRSADGATLSAQRGRVLEAESVVETGKGSTVLDLQDGSQVLVKAHSRVVLKAPKQGNPNFFELLIGNVMAKVQKRFGNAPSFKMGTPTAVITVRGTRFSVEVNKKNRTIVDVYEGLVEVVGLGFEERPVLLKPGFATQVEHDRPPERPRQLGGFGEETERGRENNRASQPGFDDNRFPGSEREAQGGGFPNAEREGQEGLQPRPGQPVAMPGQVQQPQAPAQKEPD